MEVVDGARALRLWEDEVEEEESFRKEVERDPKVYDVRMLEMDASISSISDWFEGA